MITERSKSEKLTQLREFIALGCYNIIFPGQANTVNAL
jgi:hypothetical protein